jgi:hypothetical protein
LEFFPYFAVNTRRIGEAAYASGLMRCIKGRKIATFHGDGAWRSPQRRGNSDNAWVAGGKSAEWRATVEVECNQCFLASPIPTLH